MNAEDALKLASRFILLPLEKRRLFLQGLQAEGVDFSLLPIPSAVASDERNGLSYAQRRMWFLWQLDPLSAAYNLPLAVRLEGPLSLDALQQAFDQLVARHETLRTHFQESPDAVEQVVSPPAAVAIERIDLSGLAGDAQAERSAALIEENALAPFDLAQGPLLRVRLLHLGPEQHGLSLVLHHIVADGWSLNLLIGEFMAFYDGACAGREVALAPLPIQYRDYGLWQRSWLEAGEQARQLAYWRAQLGDDHAPLQLPADHPRPLQPNYVGERLEVPIDAALAQGLRELARAHNVSLFTVLLGAFKVLLWRYSGRQAIRVGVPIGNRHRGEVEGLIGCFINTQVLHSSLDPLADVAQLLQQLKRTALDAQSHQDLPFEQLVEALEVDRSLSHSPVFQVMFNHQADVTDAAQLRSQTGLTLAPLARQSRIAQFDLTLDTHEQGGQLYGAFTYATQLFAAPTIERLAGHWVNLLQAFVDQSGARLAELPMCDQAQRQQALVDWNRTQRDVPASLAVPHLFEAQVARSPAAVALVFAGQTLSYGELNRRANQLAWYLRERAVGPEVLVGIALPRGTDMLVALLAVLKAGGAYVPLDPEFPAERLAYMLEDCAAPLLLGHAATLAQLALPSGTACVSLDPPALDLSGYPTDNPPVSASAEHLAYVIYTSGSTGRPKGVAVRHGGLNNFLASMAEAPGLRAGDRMLALTSLSFDIAGLELYLPLLCGARVVLVPGGDHRDPQALLELIAAAEVNVIQATPSSWRMLLEQAPAGAFQGKTLLCGGEALPADLARGLVEQGGALWNLYGPTETTIWSAIQALPAGTAVALGRPIGNTAIYIADSYGQPAAVGVAGELLIAGAGLARGYLNRPGLTAERFLPDPFAEQPGARLYRSGDLARFDAQGQISYVGRIDQQVKIRGFRIELGEIEAALGAHAAVRQAVVVDVQGPAGAQLLAYVVPAEQALLAQAADDECRALREALRAQLQAQLPDYMVPSQVVLLERLPLTPNGKLDRKALPEVGPSQVQRHYRAPAGELACALAAIWAQVLKVEQVGLDDNFFELGGHSLLATQVISRVRQQLQLELPLRSLFAARDLGAFAAVARSGSASQAPALLPQPRSERFALSYAQQRQWVLWQMEPLSAAYNIAQALRVRGPLDLPALQASVDAMLERHESLRTTFEQPAEQPLQQVHAKLAVPIEVEALAAGEGQDEHLRAWVNRQVERPFDLQRGPLLRVALLQVAADEQVLVLTLHHIIADGWSLPIIVEELSQGYAAFSQGLALRRPALPIQYGDYALWQRQWMEAGERQRQLDYWQTQLGGEQPLLQLPTDRPRPMLRSARGGQLKFELPGALSSALHDLARRQGVTLFVVLLASFASLLQRYSGQRDIRLGVPVANRNRLETEGLIGFFVNTQVLKADFTQVETFAQLLQQQQHTALEAQAHQDLPFEQLVEALAPVRHLNHTPLFQALCNHHAQGANALAPVPGLTLTPQAWDASHTQFDLSLETLEQAGRVSATLSYATDLFDAPSIERLAGHWRNLLHSVVANPEQRLAELPLLASAEREQIVQGWNATAADFPNLCLHQLIEQQARATPQRTALLFGEHSLTYQALNAQANRLAHKLREQGVGPESLVGVALNRSIELVVGLLAVLKAGAAYVPLDPDYPRERLAYLFADSGVQWLLTEQALLAELPIPATVQTLCLDQPEGWLADYSEADLACLNSPLNLAYMIYTSGSTGRPKGAGNSHQALVNRLHWMQKAYALDGSDTVLQKTPFSFDVSVWEFFWPLLSGARLAIAQPGEHRDPQRLVASIQRYAVTTLHFVPSMLQAFVGHADSATCQGLRRIVCSGEALSAELAQQAQAQWPATALYNLYGPTEAAIDVTHWTCQAQERISVPIGRPIDNLKTHVLDAELQVAAPGCNGELYLGGIGLARGYHRRAALTAERFVPDPFATHGGRLYRSGDLARYRGEGVLEYAGRLDHQVKIRGLRIELGEIEAGLLEHADVREAVVLDIDGPAGKQLVGYWVGGADSASLKAHLQQRLPDYMVPSHLLNLASLPVTANGKLDRKALPLPDARDAQAEYVAPRSEVEQQLAAIWADVLKLERVGLHDNFFELGGDSIVSIQVVSRARQVGLALAPKDLFEHQTVARLASVAGVGPQRAIDQRPAQGVLRPTPIQQHFFSQAMPQRNHWNQALLVQPQHPLDPNVLQQALDLLCAHHDALRLAFGEVDGQWQGTFQAEIPAGSLWHQRAAQADDLADLAASAQASLDLGEGRLLRALLVDLADGSQRLLLVIHHLTVDGVSWRILLDDLQAAYRALDQGQAPRLPSRTDSFQAWSQQLHEYAQQPAVRAELDYWQRHLSGAPTAWPVDRPDGARQARHTAQVKTCLDRASTQRLLQQAPQAYRTQINDLLLTAVTRTLCQWSGQGSVLLRLEGHGREELGGELDLTRTVGWFTSLYPVHLHNQSDLASTLKGVKEHLRGVPGKGLGYGVLRYLAEPESRQRLAALPEGEIVFNYLGQFDPGFASADPLFQPLGDGGAATLDADAPLDLLSINGQVYAGELQLSWVFSDQVLYPETVQALAEACGRELQALIEHCCAPGKGGCTPSDFPLALFDQAQLDALPIAPGMLEDLYPLAPMQQGLLFHSRYAQAGGAYVNQLRASVGGLDVARFQAAWQSVVDHHEVLRASFIDTEAGALQLIRRRMALPFELLDWRQQDQADAALAAWAAADRERGFDLATEPLLRVTLIRLAADRYELIYTCHHILLDGWSNTQLLGQVLQAYAGQPLPPRRGAYRDYIAWLQRQDVQQDQRFWVEQLALLEQPTRLAQALKPEGQRQGHGHGDHYQRLSAAQTARLTEFARSQRVTVNSLVQAAWLLLLQRYTGQRGVAFGATVAGRPVQLPHIEAQLGLFINTLPVAAAPSPEQPVAQWVQQVQGQNLRLREHEHSPLADIQGWAGHNAEALFDTLLVFENYPIAAALQQGAEHGLAFSEIRQQEQTHLPLTLSVTLGETLAVHYSFDREHFQASAVARLAEHFEQLLLAMVAAPQAAIGELPMLVSEERQWLHDICPAPLAQPQLSLKQWFEAQAAQTPEALAVIHGQQEVSYASLNRRANQLARRLRELGVGPDVQVGIALARNVDLVVGLLAVLKAGGAYVPLDPAYPRERLAYMLNDSQAALLLSHSDLLERLPETFNCTPLLLDQFDFAAYPDANLACVGGPANLAYTIYTSGSTGAPKGVLIEQRNASALITWARTCYSRDDLCGVLASTSICFDLSVWELFVTLSCGGYVILADNALQLPELPARGRVRLINSVPSAVKALCDAGQLPGSLRIVNLAGEPLPQALVERLYQQGAVEHVYDLYGPSEDTTYSTWARREPGGQATIGRPLPNSAAYLLGLDGQMVAARCTGELYLAGAGLSRGYLGRPGLTAEKFLPDPFAASGGGRLYRTGDLARYRADGALEYVGRSDHQVKIRGYRVEPGEIEACLQLDERVAEARVLAIDGVVGKQLVAYLVPRDSTLVDAPASAQAAWCAALRGALRERLAEYLVPAHVVLLQRIPLTPNGKLDRQALPLPDSHRHGPAYRAPQSDLQTQLAQVWAQVLKVERVGLDDNFFELGGQSLLAALAISRINSRLGIDLPLRQLFERPQLNDFALAVEESGLSLSDDGLSDIEKMINDMAQA